MEKRSFKLVSSIVIFLLLSIGVNAQKNRLSSKDSIMLDKALRLTIHSVEMLDSSTTLKMHSDSLMEEANKSEDIKIRVHLLATASSDLMKAINYRQICTKELEEANWLMKDVRNRNPLIFGQKIADNGYILNQ